QYPPPAPSSPLFFVILPASSTIYPLSLHDALPIYPPVSDPSAINDVPEATLAAEPPLEPPGTRSRLCGFRVTKKPHNLDRVPGGDRKSTRLNSSHVAIAYAVFCLEEKQSQHDATGG